MFKFICKTCGKEFERAGRGQTRQVGGVNKTIAYRYCNKSCFILGITKHGCSGKHRTVEYYTWNSMNARCFDPKDMNYKYYGKKGVTVCDRWKNSFENFLEDMGKKPSATHSIDRIAVLGNYEPSNCRWATLKEQQSNRRDNVKIKDVILAEWARQLGIPGTTFHRLFTKYGRNEEAIQTIITKYYGVDICI